MDYFGINSADDLPKIKEILNQEIVEATKVEKEEERLKIKIARKRRKKIRRKLHDTAENAEDRKRDLSKTSLIINYCKKTSIIIISF